MVKIPPINITYFHKQKVPVEIVYSQIKGKYRIVAFTCYKEGKGLVFNSERSQKLNKIFEKLKYKSISLRLITLHRVISILERKIKKRNIPYLGLYKMKNPGTNFVKLKIR